MKKIAYIARLFFLVAALCFAVSIGTVAASSGQPAADSSHTAAADQGAAVDNTHSAGAEASHADEGGHGAAAGGSLSAAKLKDLFWRVINFIALMIILVKFGAKPIGSALAGRRQRIKDELSDLEARRTAAEASYREFEVKLAGVEKDIDTVVEKALAQAEIEKQKIIEKAEKAADDIKRQAELTIQNEIMEARRTLKNDVADQAAVMAKELIVKNLTPDDQVKIIEDYLDKVGAVQ
ncbi:MAG: ATP synthase F0 subunit B [Desulfocapsaceae bacterium]|jgi:F-type H+-transporting ATPase subunit b|nr:ATP synthase F0 subunit B [Desulfocapsaceae bacterium]